MLTEGSIRADLRAGYSSRFLAFIGKRRVFVLGRRLATLVFMQTLIDNRSPQRSAVAQARPRPPSSGSTDRPGVIQGDGFSPLPPRPRLWACVSGSRELAQPLHPIQLPASALWAELLAGHCTISSDLTTSTYCYLTLRRTQPARHPRHLPEAQTRALEALFFGVPLKSVAMDLHRSQATVSTMAQRWLRGVGISQRPFGRAPLLLAIIGNSRTSKPELMVSVRTSSLEDQVHTVVSFPRPDAALEPRLSRAEYETARLALEGATHKDIAAARGRSERTVANQLGATFRKLGASGRFQLLGVALRAGQESSRIEEVRG